MTEAPSPAKGERIAKVIAHAGLCSRRTAEQWIADGRVTLNGKALSSPAVTVGETDRITVDGKPLPGRPASKLWRYHKPPGLLTTHRDPEGRPTLFDRLPEDLGRVISVGRLDFTSEGLLLLTNDGDLARHLELPATGWARRYRVRVYGLVDEQALEQLEQGATVEGIRYGPITAHLDSGKGPNSWLTLTLREGKNREVRKVLEHLGLTVNRLIRTSYGPFQLGTLGRGEVAAVPSKVLREQLGKGVLR
jgi:23S rRNA pseudouridine2605 synthase